MIHSLPNFSVALVVMGTLLTGCSEKADGPPTARVSGTVTFQGQPVQAGKVNFESDPPGYGASATIKQGKFSVDGDVVLGNYKVTITPPPPGPPVPGQTAELVDAKDIPEQYRVVKTSDLTAKVESGSNTFKFELK